MSNQPEQENATTGVGGLDDAEVDRLVQRAQERDGEAFDQLVRLYGGLMFNLAYRVVNSRADAEDLTQEIFIRVHRSIGRFGGQAKFSTWLYAVALNTCRSGLRRLKRVGSMEIVRLDEGGPESDSRRREAADPGDSPDASLRKRELRTQVEEAVAELAPEFRTVVVLRDLQGLSYEEIADALDCSVGTVKSRLARARVRVKERLIREGVTCDAMS